MNNGLDPVRNKLDELPHPVAIFFRDDDAGWEDARLYRLLDLFARHDLPIDLAAIPMALNPALGRELSDRMAGSPEKVRVHQHGYAHVNHESIGKKCEFGVSRTKAAQRRDIQSGMLRLRELFGDRADPIFTPPWNRCTVETGECLVELGISVLSRESGAAPLAIPGLLELPVQLDWFAHRKKVRLRRDEWAQSLASKLDCAAPVGIMFHHAVMEPAEMDAAAELLAILAGHPNVQCRSLLNAAAIASCR